jgi:hypothetical protein
MISFASKHSAIRPLDGAITTENPDLRRILLHMLLRVRHLLPLLLSLLLWSALAARADASPNTSPNAFTCARPSATSASCTAKVEMHNGHVVSFAAIKHHRPHLDALVTARPHAPVSEQADIASTATQPLIESEPTSELGTPQFLQQAYDLSALSATAGSGDTVGIVDFGVGYNELASDLAAFRSDFALPACTIASGCLTITDENGGNNYSTTELPANQDGGWGFETALDVDAVSSICPNCHILVVETQANTPADMATAEQTAARLGANQISNSWGIALPSGQTAPFDTSFAPAGTAVVAAGGDSGFLGDATSELPASLSDVTAVGGTNLGATMQPLARGVNEQGSTADSSDCSTLPAPSWQTGTGCSGRADNDISADGDPGTGLDVYYSGNGHPLRGYNGGGTSLSSPIVAAYYALIGGGIGDGGAEWAYQASDLNDITGSSPNGNCTAMPLLCQPGPGWDGVTGVGSISGALVTGAPGVSRGTSCFCGGNPSTYITTPGGQVTGSSVVVSGGVTPNGADTHYWWEYGIGNLDHSTPAVDIGQGRSAELESTTLTGLTPGASYDVALVASNRFGTVAYDPASGFALNLVTGSTPSVPTISISGAPSGTITATSANFALLTGGAVSAIACTLDGAVVPCSGSVSLSGLSSGNHTFSAEAIGPGGEQTTSTSWIVNAPKASTPAGSAPTTPALPVNPLPPSITTILIPTGSVPPNGSSTPISIPINSTPSASAAKISARVSHQGATTLVILTSNKPVEVTLTISAVRGRHRVVVRQLHVRLRTQTTIKLHLTSGERVSLQR